MSRELFLLPGWGLGRGPWQPTADALGGRILDLPGYGDAPLVESFSAAADTLAAHLPPASHLCGWSLGAMLALAIAVRNPDRVSKLILVAGTASFVQRPDWSAALPPAALAEFCDGIAADIEAMLPRFVGAFNRGDLAGRALTRKLLARADPLPCAQTLATGLTWLRDTDLRAIVPLVRSPTLLVHGAVDPLMPLSAAEALQAMMPEARLQIFPGRAHAPFLSDPQGFRDALTAFRNDSSA